MSAWISTLLPSIIAIIAAVFAWRQWIVNRDKLKSDLFERRHVYYQAARELISRVVAGGPITPEMTTKFLRHLQGARFVLNDGLADYLENELYARAVTLQALETDLSAMDSSPERMGIVRRQREIRNWFEEQDLVLERKFRSVLKLDH